MKKYLLSASLVVAMMSGGCASGPSTVQSIAESVTVWDGVALIGGAYLLYSISEMPTWEVKIFPGKKNKASAELTKSNWSEGGDGSASFVFGRAAQKHCESLGFAKYNIDALVEFWEPTMIGSKRKATGRFTCAT
jgi:hypothetical protein